MRKGRNGRGSVSDYLAWEDQNHLCCHLAGTIGPTNSLTVLINFAQHLCLTTSARLRATTFVGFWLMLQAFHDCFPPRILALSNNVFDNFDFFLARFFALF